MLSRFGRSQLAQTSTVLHAAQRTNSTLSEKLREAGSGNHDERARARAVERTENEIDQNGEAFRGMYVMPKRKLNAQIQLERMTGRMAFEKRSRMDIHDRLAVRRPRSQEMSPDQDWSDVWPAARSFNASSVPLPVRMGSRPDVDKRAPFKKQGNLELVKIPNFLHLTPATIEKHCEAIKKFCTSFPSELKESSAGSAELQSTALPITLSYSDYVHQGTNIRDNRSRVVTMRVEVASLGLSKNAEEKLARLAGDRYNEKERTLTIVTDRCHTRQQNTDYAHYLLTVLFHEANKMEAWEKEMKTRQDNTKVEFAGSACEQQLLSVLESASKHDGLESAVKDSSAEQIAQHPKVVEFANMWSKYRNEEETPDATREYARQVRELLGLPPVHNTVSKH